MKNIRKELNKSMEGLGKSTKERSEILDELDRKAKEINRRSEEFLKLLEKKDEKYYYFAIISVLLTIFTMLLIVIFIASLVFYHQLKGVIGVY